MPAPLPRVVSMACLPTAPRGICDWHQHVGDDELCLVMDTPSRLGHGGVARDVRPGTLFLFRRGERHGYWNTAEQSPHLWVLHYRADDALDAECPRLAARDPERRTWRLDAERAAAFQGLFLKVLGEHRRRDPAAAAAASAWLRLLLVAVHRWAGGDDDAPAAPSVDDPELLALWKAVNDAACAPRGDRALMRVPNYDSLRHRFARAFGASPARLRGDLVIERAMSLLLETDLPIAAIAERVGYARQHEFARAFRQRTGKTPTAWRERPA